MNFLNKLQNKPIYVKKTILWLVIVILGLILTVIWINGSYKKIQKLKSQNIIQELNLPNLEMPDLEMPVINE